MGTWHKERSRDAWLLENLDSGHVKTLDASDYMASHAEGNCLGPWNCSWLSWLHIASERSISREALRGLLRKSMRTAVNLCMGRS
jgi:hypothetical protein